MKKVRQSTPHVWKQGIRHRIGLGILATVVGLYMLIIFFAHDVPQDLTKITVDSLSLNSNNQLVKRNNSKRYPKSWPTNTTRLPKKTFAPFKHNFTKVTESSWGHSNRIIHRFPTIDLETADSASLEKLPGIGPVLSVRIVKYRDRLGGFHNKVQLKEVYGLTDSVFEKIGPYLTLNSSAVQKIEINRAGETQLAKHPYIQWKLARQFVRYREQHGLFQSANDLYGLWTIDTEKIKKLIPYLLFNADSSVSK